MNEMNAEVVQVTNHACAGKGNYHDHSDWQCHKWGEPLFKTKPFEFGIGKAGGIDTKKKFNFAQEFKMEGNSLVVETTLTQGATKKKYNLGPNNAELDRMMNDGSLLRGMAFVTGYWTDPKMNWLDGDSCGQGAENCNNNPIYLGNWRITTNSPSPPAPPPSPAPPGPAPAPAPPSGASDCHSSGTWSCGAIKFE